MLESQALWLSEPNLANDPHLRNAAGVRQVRKSHDGAELGRIAVHRLRWWPWPVRWFISAFEGPDQSAVFAGRRAGWLPRDWDVVDADGRLIGLVRNPFLLGAEGAIVGKLSRSPDRRSGSVVDPGGKTIACWAPDEESGTRVEFASEIADQPFIKMTILLAVLIAL
jgi:hypothetical protein